VSLSRYVKRMKEGQKHIYYIAGVHFFFIINLLKSEQPSSTHRLSPTVNWGP